MPNRKLTEKQQALIDAVLVNSDAKAAAKMGRMKDLEAENTRLKKMYADVQLQTDVMTNLSALGPDQFQ
jgi:hypothetical protein